MNSLPDHPVVKATVLLGDPVYSKCLLKQTNSLQMHQRQQVYLLLMLLAVITEGTIMTEGLSSMISNTPLVDTGPQSVGYWDRRKAWVVRGARGGGIHLLRYSDFTSGYSACGLRPNSWQCATLSGPDKLCDVCAVLVEMEQ